MNRRDVVHALCAAVVTAASCALSAQQPGKVWRIGYLSLGGANGNPRNVAAFLKGMRELGYVEGKNLVIEWRFAEGRAERMPGLAAELVQLKVDVIVAQPSGAAAAAQKATTTIPIVMATSGDPVGRELVKSLSRPGGNVTGLSTMGADTGAKLVELLRAMLPKLTRVAVLKNSGAINSASSKSVQAAAQKAGLTVLVAEASTLQDLENGFAMMAREKAGAIIVGTASFSALQHRQIADLARKARLPSVFGERGYVEAGGLMSYGTKYADLHYRAATYVDKILRGANPGELPVEQPSTLELVVNLKTAKALGLTIPQAILVRADELIE